jgi:hypothetical protein
MHQDPSSAGVQSSRGAAPPQTFPFMQHEHGAYRGDAQVPEGAMCPACHASVHDGHWEWLEAGPGAVQVRCPACRRIDDDFPAGFVTIEGDFFERHRVELMHLVQTRANQAAAGHPLRRLMRSSDTPEGVLLTTTDTHLARQIGAELRDTYGGTVNFSYESDQEMLRVYWAR